MRSVQFQGSGDQPTITREIDPALSNPVGFKWDGRERHKPTFNFSLGGQGYLNSAEALPREHWREARGKGTTP